MSRPARGRAERELGERSSHAADAASTNCEGGGEVELDGFPALGGGHFAANSERNASRCLPTMAVRAADVAFLNFAEYLRPTATRRRVARDISDLAAPMVELEHDDVRLAAVDAWVIQ